MDSAGRTPSSRGWASPTAPPPGVTVAVGTAPPGVNVAVGTAPPGVTVAVAPPLPGVTVAVAPPPPGVGLAVSAPPPGVGVAVALLPPPLHSAGYVPALGAAAAVVQALLNSLMQARHATALVRSVIGPPHAEPPGTVTAGQVVPSPIAAGARSSPPPHAPSPPPHFPHTFSESLSRSRATWFVVAASGQDPPPPFSTVSRQRACAFTCPRIARARLLPISRWQKRASEVVPDAPNATSAAWSTAASSMQATQSLTSSQLPSAPLQLPLSRFEQLPTNPIDASASSSPPLPQL